MTLDDDDNLIGPIAERFRGEGYRVCVRPIGPLVPTFLGDVTPDLIAERDGGGVVLIQVADRAEMVADPNIKRLAGLMRDHPAWRLDVLVVGDAPVWADPDVAAAEPTTRELKSMLASGRALAEGGHLDAAYVIGWGAVEATLRAVARAHGLAVGGRPPRGILDLLRRHGVITGADHARLNRVVRVRNAIAHGLRTAATSVPEIAGAIALASDFVDGRSRPAA